MTFEEAKEILKKEGWTKFQKLAYRPKGLKRPEWEKPTVVEALEVCYDNHVLPLILREKLSEREERLKAEYEKQCPDCEKKNQIVDKLIEEEGTSGVGMSLHEAIEMLLDKGYVLIKATDEHPSQADGFFDRVLKCAVATVNANGYMVSYDETVNVTTQEYVDAAKEFNDSLLDEQAKKIKDLEKKNIILNEKVVTMSKELGAERCTSKILIEKFNEIRSLKKKLRKMRSIADGFRKEINTLTSRIIDFRKSIKEKDEVIEDISEELRLSKEREEELIATVKDYLALVGDKDEEIKKLKKELANIVVNNVDAQALKSAESALVYKDKVIEKLKENDKNREITSKLKEEIIKEKDRTIKILMNAFGNNIITCKGNPFKDSIEIIKAPF